MLSIKKVRHVRALLATGMGCQRAAEESGVSRSTVYAIAREERDWEPDEYELAGGPVERCPRCGRMVEMPCRVCLAENARDAQSAEPTGDAPAAHCAPQLFGPARERYEAVREARVHAFIAEHFAEPADSADEFSFIATDTLLAAFELEDDQQPDFLEEQNNESEYE